VTSPGPDAQGAPVALPGPPASGIDGAALLAPLEGLDEVPAAEQPAIFAAVLERLGRVLDEDA